MTSVHVTARVLLAAAVLCATACSSSPPVVEATDASVAPPPKFPGALSDIDGRWVRVGGAGFVKPSLTSQQIMDTMTGREPLEQEFQVEGGAGIAINEGHGRDGDPEWCRGDRDITFSIGEGGGWSVVESAPRIYGVGKEEELKCKVYLGYAIFSHKPLPLERVERIGDKLVFAYTVEGRPNELVAQVFELQAKESAP